LKKVRNLIRVTIGVRVRAKIRVRVGVSESVKIRVRVSVRFLKNFLWIFRHTS
jgi:hypothetical protein